MTLARVAGIALATLMLAVVCSPPGSGPSFTASALGGADTMASAVFHQVSIFQGDDPGTEAREPDGLAQVIWRSLWHVPWNASSVYLAVPDGAQGVSYDNVEPFSHAGSTVYVPGRYSATANPSDPPAKGTLTGGRYEGMRYWTFPASADRSSNVTLEPVPATGGALFDANLTDAGAWNVTDGKVRLAGGTSATMTSPVVLECHDVVAVNLTWTGDPGSGSVALEASADNGTTWVPVANATEVPMAGTDGALRWRLTMTAPYYVYPAPAVDSLRLVVRQVPLAEDLWFQADWTMSARDGLLEVPLSFRLDAAGAGLVMLVYADEGTEVRVTGTNVTSSTLEDLPGKTVYRHMQGAYAGLVVVRMELEEGGGTSTAALVVLFLVVIAIAGIFGYVATTRRRRPADRAGVEEGGEATSGEAPGEDAVDDGADGEDEGAGPSLSELTVGELERRKQRLLRAIKRVDAELEDGLIGEEEHADVRAGYKERAADVMRELDSRKGR